MVAREKIKKLPDTPGVYLMKDAQGRILYVGKAVSLKKRVSSYFSKTQDSVKTRVMLSAVKDVSYVKTASEYAALILESELIKKHKPRFNISLKDDKSYPYIKITREEIPRVFIGRRRKNERGVDLFGPYTSANLLKKALTILRRSFPYCSCRRFPKKVCLNYHLGLCPAPCQRKISKKRYVASIVGLQNFLTQEDAALVEAISRQMRECVREEQFEKAASLRDQLEALEVLGTIKRAGFAKGAGARRTETASLGLKKEPRRLEAFDVSHIQSRQAVASMVSFFDGLPDKKNYRRFKIRTVRAIDDCAMIREVVFRRYRRIQQEDGSFPDLVVIDGGRGQLTAAQEALRALKVVIPIIAIAKSQELIYTIRKRNPVRLPAASRLLRLIQAVRDEAHRFAISYHRLLRKKDVFKRS